MQILYINNICFSGDFKEVAEEEKQMSDRFKLVEKGQQAEICSRIWSSVSHLLHQELTISDLNIVLKSDHEVVSILF